MGPTVILLVLLKLAASLHQTDSVELNLEGLVPAVYTPFDEEEKLNVSVIPEYAEYLKENHVDGVLLAGTSGEGPSLTLSERKELLDVWLKEAKPRGLKVVMQVGGMTLSNVLDMAAYSEAVGADAILTLPELYYKPATESAVVSYVKMVSEAAPKLPILYYHHPSISGVKINVAKFFEEATTSIPNFKGMKCDFISALQVLATGQLQDSQRVFMTSHLTMASNTLMGLNSSMTAVISIFPKLFVAIEEAIRNSDVVKARQLQKELNERVAIITSQGDYVPISKAAMELLTGVRVGRAREPLKRISSDQKRALEKSLQELQVK